MNVLMFFFYNKKIISFLSIQLYLFSGVLLYKVGGCLHFNHNSITIL